jgi:predicted metal-dependent hydrolase
LDRRHQRSFELQERQVPREYIERESHYFLGKRYLLRIKENNSSNKVELRTKTYIDLFVRPNSTIEQRQTIIYEWYRNELKKQVQPLIEKWQKQIGVTVDDWQIKQMKTKWGTCNIEKKRVWVNLELAKKPIHCLEYIIVHELIHLIERHHNEKFLSLLERHLPQWKFYREELNRLPVSHGEWTY